MGRWRYKTTEPRQSYCVTMIPCKSAEDMRYHAGAWERDKNRNRTWKIALIEKANPEWRDLIFEEGELQRNSVVANFATTAADEKTYQIGYYNLDVIISVGYCVKSLRGTQFRIWASNILKEYLKKGFALNDERLKNLGGGNYWKYPRSHAPAWECIPHPQSAFPRGSVGTRNIKPSKRAVNNE